jgi:hypothetical protein
MRSTRAAIVILVASATGYALRYTVSLGGRADWRVIAAASLACVAVGQLALATLLALRQVAPIRAEHGPTAIGQVLLAVVMLAVASLLWSTTFIPASAGWALAAACILFSVFGSPVERPPQANHHAS